MQSPPSGEGSRQSPDVAACEAQDAVLLSNQQAAIHCHISKQLAYPLLPSSDASDPSTDAPLAPPAAPVMRL